MKKLIYMIIILIMSLSCSTTKVKEETIKYWKGSGDWYIVHNDTILCKMDEILLTLQDKTDIIECVLKVNVHSYGWIPENNSQKYRLILYKRNGAAICDVFIDVKVFCDQESNRQIFKFNLAKGHMLLKDIYYIQNYRKIINWKTCTGNVSIKL